MRLLRARRRTAESSGSRYEAFGLAEFCDSYPGLQPAQWVDYLALKGDAVDNVPGVRVRHWVETPHLHMYNKRRQGIGDKSALQMLQTHGNLDNIFANVDDDALPKRARSALKGTGAEEAARLSKRLVQLQVHLELPQLQFDVEELAIGRPPQGSGVACKMLERWDVVHLVPAVQTLFG